MADPVFTPSFLRRVVELEKRLSSAELDLLDKTLARVAADPNLPECFPTFYDPQLPTYFIRADPFMIEFAIDDEAEAVTFVSLFYRS